MDNPACGESSAHILVALEEIEDFASAYTNSVKDNQAPDKVHKESYRSGWL